VFPKPYPQWSSWKSSIELLNKNLRWVTIDVDFVEASAVRIGIFQDDDDPWEVRPPIAPFSRPQ
jgi:hypothetical protein